MLTPNVLTISSLCSADQPSCVGVTLSRPDRPWWRRLLYGSGDVVEMTDTKLDVASPVERFTLAEWRRFLRRDVWSVTPAADRLYRVGDLAYTTAEWDAFRDGVAAGDFATT